MEPRNIVIFGVSKGIGRAWCEELLARGHRVFGCARNQEKIDELSKKYPEHGSFAVVDILDLEQVVGWAAQVLAGGPAPDLIINNAAVIHKSAIFEDIPPEEFRRVLDINVHGMANCIRAFLPTLKQTGRGVMVNMSSGWGRYGQATTSAYSCSKFAVEGLTESISREVPEGVAVLTLAPGGRGGDGVDTEMSCDYRNKPQGEHLEDWAPRASDYVLSLNASHNGQKLKVPDEFPQRG